MKVKKLKKVFLNNLGLFFSAREKFLHNCKNRLFPIKNLDKIPTHQPTPQLATEPTEDKISKLKLQQEFMNGIRAEKKDRNLKYFGIILSTRIHRF